MYVATPRSGINCSFRGRAVVVVVLVDCLCHEVVQAAHQNQGAILCRKSSDQEESWLMGDCHTHESLAPNCLYPRYAPSSITYVYLAYTSGSGIWDSSNV